MADRPAASPPTPSGTTLDLGAVDLLCRLQVAAHALDCTIVVRERGRELTELITLAGLSDVLLDDGVERDAGPPHPTTPTRAGP